MLNSFLVNSARWLTMLSRETKNLRTFLPIRMSLFVNPACELSNKFFQDALTQLMSLRVLSLSHYLSIVKLPNLFSGLKQLRFLNLSSTNIQKLPNWICSLYNLQTLLLSSCRTVEELPADFGQLIDLRYLDIRGIPLKKMSL